VAVLDVEPYDEGDDRDVIEVFLDGFGLQVGMACVVGFADLEDERKKGHHGNGFKMELDKD
jgi:hypothetical protein